MESFEKEFSQLREMKEEFVLRGSSIIVEILDDEELKTKGGIIIATKDDQVKGNSVNQHKLQVGRVLMTGPGYWNDERTKDVSISIRMDNGLYRHETNTVADPGYDPLEVKPGAIVVLPQFATSVISMFPGIQRPTSNKLGIVKMDSVLCYFSSQEAYEQVKAKLN